LANDKGQQSSMSASGAQLEFLESIGAPLTLQGGYQPHCRPFAEWPDERAMNGLFSKASKQAA
jgi:hypothetical protein